eukprot:2618355-Rhodomonas_salina.3
MVLRDESYEIGPVVMWSYADVMSFCASGSRVICNMSRGDIHDLHAGPSTNSNTITNIPGAPGA